MNLHQLETLYWLAQLQNYQRVADKLRLSQPAISARINTLEETLGALLIDRSKAHFSLTDQGYDVVQYAERMLDLRDSMVRKISEPDSERNRLRIAAASLSVMTLAPRLFDALAQRFPNLICDVISASDHQLAQHIEAGSVDVAFLSNAPPTVQVSKLFTVHYEIRWIAHRDLIAPGRKTYRVEDLKRLPIIHYPRTSPLFPMTEAYLGETQLSAASRHSANSLGTIVQMLKQRMGIAAIPAIAVAEEIEAGELAVLPAEQPLRVLKVRCAYANMARRELIDTLAEMAGEAAMAYCAENPQWTRFVPGE